MTENNIIELKNIRKKFGNKIVHQNINLAVRRGEVMTLMGGSGSGKSVLLRSIIGLDRADAGKILFDGCDVCLLAEEELIPIRKRIAYVFQYGALFDSFTVFENLAYPLREHTKLSEREIRDRVMGTLAKVGLEGNETLFPADLSGGMQRRVGVARSIVMNPEVILYDEPTTGLDPFNTLQIVRIIEQLKAQGATSLLVTHDMQTIFRVSDRVAFLNEGIIQAIGTAREMQHSSDPDVSSFIQGERM